MGRPPIGERAMTAAEKQKRYRQRKAAPAFRKGDRVTTSSEVGLRRRLRAAADRELSLRSQLAQAEREIAKLKKART